MLLFIALAWRFVQALLGALHLGARLAHPRDSGDQRKGARPQGSAAVDSRGTAEVARRLKRRAAPIKLPGRGEAGTFGSVLAHEAPATGRRRRWNHYFSHRSVWR